MYVSPGFKEEVYESIFVIQSGNSLGSGFAMGANCVVTNAHVIDNKNKVTIRTYSGDQLPATVVGMDQNLDIAVLRVENVTFRPLQIADLETQRIGDDVYAIGAPKSMAYLLNYQTSVNNQLTIQNNVITKQSSTITDLQNKLSGHTTTIEELSAWIKESELKLEEQEAIIKELESKLEGNDDNYVRFISYTVAAGDSLIKICQAHNIDYVANQKLILAINGIADPNVVYVGQTILLPIQN